MNAIDTSVLPWPVLLTSLALLMGSCLLMLSTRSLYYLIFGLLLALMGVSGMYLALLADFLAVAQIIIYVGGTLMLLLFGILLTGGGRETIKLKYYLTIIVSVSFLGWPFFTIYQELSKLPALHSTQLPAFAKSNSTEALGEVLATDALLPLELFAILLLAVLIGAGWYYKRAIEK